LQAEKPRPILVGGIHGVGKSTLISKVCAELRLPHLVASKVIHQFKIENRIEHKDTGKRTNNIDANQDVLISALNNAAIESPTYILDGHFTLFDSHGAIQTVPTSTFMAIKPIGLFVIIDDPESIQSRLLLRDEKAYCSTQLEEMQLAEVNHAANVARDLGIKLHKISSVSEEPIREFIIGLNRDRVL